MIAQACHLPAPAKLNLFLHVTGRRGDGYHLIETVYELIDWADSIDLRVRDDGAIVRVGAVTGVAAEDDLTVRAARLLARHSGSRLGVEICLDKRLPIGGGLGGGSSDAATTLLALNRLWSLHWSPARLARVALELGADVPFFVRGRTAYATGIGERLRPLALASRWYVVLAPENGVATASVFAAPELTRDTKPLKISGLSRGRQVFRGRNDLQPVVLARHPGVARALETLRQAARAVGIDARLARMTGSGACVFLPVRTEHDAARVRGQVQAQLQGQGVVAVARSLPVHPLRDWAFAPS